MTTAIPRVRPRPRPRLAATALLLGCCLALITGCTEDAGPRPAGPPDGDLGRVRLGFSVGMDDTPLNALPADPAKKRAGQLGVTLVEGQARSKCENQIRDLENYLATGVDAITFLGLCGDGKAYDRVVREGRAKGVAMVSYAFQHPDADGAITFDDRTAGQLEADDAVAWLRNKFHGDFKDFSWGLLPCSFAPPAIQQRTEIPKDRIVALTGKKPLEKDCAQDPQSAQETVETWLRTDPGLDMVLAQVDAGALGAYRAYKQNPSTRPGQVYVGGINGEREVVELIARGGDSIFQFTAARTTHQPSKSGIWSRTSAPSARSTESASASAGARWSGCSATTARARARW
ncbi:substrate-binding domain-containing protein [Embleya sp. NBC_00896]|uniref:sugar ABC transporter substrate-binding protein n=1 Tax=Embleya sp. NBC_00896 TaxID=2975961 RepID=UPI002F9163C6|nr:substrate-binding domain-containing protein [Embleya sp. NBC_00896]